MLVEADDGAGRAEALLPGEEAAGDRIGAGGRIVAAGAAPGDRERHRGGLGAVEIEAGHRLLDAGGEAHRIGAGREGDALIADVDRVAGRAAHRPLGAHLLVAAPRRGVGAVAAGADLVGDRGLPRAGLLALGAVAGGALELGVLVRARGGPGERWPPAGGKISAAASAPRRRRGRRRGRRESA